LSPRTQKSIASAALWLLCLALILMGNFGLMAQRLLPRKPTNPVVAPDSLQKRSASLPGVGVTMTSADSTKKDTLQAESDLKSTVVYSAKDSTIMDPTAQEVHLYGQAKVTYGAIVLQADYIRLNWTTNEVFAKGTYDTTSKKWVGEPIFEDNGEKYDTKELRYNFKTRKGFIKGIVTQQGDGNIRGTTVKKDAEDNMYIRGSIYTTCNLTHPHFHIAAKKIKVIPEKQVISGPFNLVIADVPLPLGLPFGFFPIPKKKEIGTSGLIMPTYGEEPNGRGYYLRDGGYYWAISDKINMSITGQIYSRGSWGVGLAMPYAVKYRFNGNFNLRFNRNVQGNEIKVLNKPRNDFSLNWTHTPVTRGTSSFGASVNIGSNSFNQFNEFSTQRYIQNVAGSSVQYNKQFGQFARMGTSVRVNQRFPDRSKVDAEGKQIDPGAIDAGIDFNFGINQIAPFALKGGTGAWYESFRLGMDFSGGLTANNNIVYADTSSARLGFVWANPPSNVVGSSTSPITTYALNTETFSQFIKNSQFTGRFSIPISLPNIKLFRYINITPGISMSGDAFTQKFQYKYISGNKVQVDTLKGFYFANNVSFSASVNTRLYGTMFIKGKRLEAIRHTLIPSASINYVPDQSNLYEKTVVNQNGEVRYLNRYRTVGGNLTTSGTSAAAISWSLNNLFEAKLRPKSDSTGKQFEKKSILDNLSLNGSYNLMADSLNMSDISLAANAQLFKNLNFNFSASFDPYAYVQDAAYGTVGRKINKYSVMANQGLAKLSNMNIAFSTRFAPKGADKPKKANTPNTEEQQRMINANPAAYVDFNIPWTINFSYNFGYTKQGLAKATTIQSLTMQGDFSLTPKWKFTYSTGVDVVAKAPSITNVGIIRDLHCWEMSFNWTPFAGSGFRVNNYNFEIRAKSALLRDLKLSRRRSFYDQGGF